jgi:hypothetical protein
LDQVKSEDARLKTNPRHKARLLRKQAQAEEYFAKKVQMLLEISLSFNYFAFRKPKKMDLIMIVYKLLIGQLKKSPNGKPRKRKEDHEPIKDSLTTAS